MAKQDDFYIGYLADQPKGISSFNKRMILLIALVVVGVALLFAISQQPFKNATFEIANMAEVEGVLYKKPYPMLRVNDENGGFKNVVLLGFGKFGAENGLAEIEKQLSSDLEGIRLKLKGNLSYYNGKTFLQLPADVTGSFERMNADQKDRRRIAIGKQKVQGEIIDPKCYFGVMKPGRGKIHRSCAVRCIAGGIPPVFVNQNEKGEETYYLLTDRNDQPINQEVLGYIGKLAEVQGEVEQLEDWNILKVNPAQDIKIIQETSNIYTP